MTNLTSIYNNSKTDLTKHLPALNNDNQAFVVEGTGLFVLRSTASQPRPVLSR
jgi:hypothetical protein